MKRKLPGIQSPVAERFPLRPRFPTRAFHLREQIEPYQFSLTSNKHERIHGFFIDEVFYVVWADPKHKLYET